MRRFKNNKGITGIDIVVSISLIVIVLGIAMTVYTSYSNKTKEVERTSVATNLAMKVIEKIEEIDINTIDNSQEIKNDTSDTIKQKYGLDGENIGPYIINIQKINPSDAILQKLQNVAFQVDVTVNYNVQNEDKKVTLSTIKKYEDVGEAQAPIITKSIDEGGNIQYKIPTNIEVIPVKIDESKGGYVKSDSKDSDWYSISSKRFPVVVTLSEGKNFDRNGVIQLKDCEKVYVWMPSYGKNGTEYRFCDNNGKIIKYTKDSTTKIGTYQAIGNSVTSKVEGQWIEVDSELKAKSSNVNYNNLRNNIFTWE